MQIKTFPTPVSDAVTAAKEINIFRRANRNFWCVVTIDIGTSADVFTVRIKFFNYWPQKLIIISPNGKEVNYGQSAPLTTEKDFISYVATAITTEQLRYAESVEKGGKENV